MVHDPQPCGIIKYAKPKVEGVAWLWQSHIGLEQHTERTKNAWNFIHEYLEMYDETIFTSDAYVPSFLRKHYKLITPAINPSANKNKKLDLHDVFQILFESGFMERSLISCCYTHKHSANILDRNLKFEIPHKVDFDFFTRPLIVQISRWDRLKGFKELLLGFLMLKRMQVNHLPKEA